MFSLFLERINTRSSLGNHCCLSRICRDTPTFPGRLSIVLSRLADDGPVWRTGRGVDPSLQAWGLVFQAQAYENRVYCEASGTMCNDKTKTT